MNLRQHKRRAVAGMARRLDARGKGLDKVYRVFLMWRLAPGIPRHWSECLRYQWRGYAKS